MGGTRMKQAAFAWTLGESTAPDCSAAEHPLPEAPPTVRGGGARGAWRERHTQRRERSGPVATVAAHGIKLWPKARVRHIRFHDLRHTYGSVLLMLGANLVSVQRLVGHSDPKITERRYSHFSPDFMSTEVNRLRFGLPALAPALPLPPTSAENGSGSQDLAAPSTPLGTPLVQLPRNGERKGRDPTEKSLEVPASELARDTGFEPVAFGSGGRQATLRWVRQSLATRRNRCRLPRRVIPRKSKRVQGFAAHLSHFCRTFC